MTRMSALLMLAATMAACARGSDTNAGATTGATAIAQPASSLRQPGPDPRAPDTVRVAFETGKGRFVVEAVRAWAPAGVDRFHHLVTLGFYDRAKFFRVVENFMVQFGMHGEPDVNATWRERKIPDDSVRQSNKEGYVTFAMGGPATRTTQLFINLKDNARLDAMGFAPIGRVVEGMDIVKSLYSGYGDSPPNGAGPMQDLIARRGVDYLNRFFPQLDSIVTARVVR